MGTSISSHVDTRSAADHPPSLVVGIVDGPRLDDDVHMPGTVRFNLCLDTDIHYASCPIEVYALLRRRLRLLPFDLSISAHRTIDLKDSCGFVFEGSGSSRIRGPSALHGALDLSVVDVALSVASCLGERTSASGIIVAVAVRETHSASVTGLFHQSDMTNVTWHRPAVLAHITFSAFALNVEMLMFNLPSPSRLAHA